tara:strand:- start:148 stop:402 length:255 start_codon:yes stop_codon:yes gene_type:complete
MYLHEKELITQVRVYNTPEGYNNKKPYEAILTLQYIGDDEVFIEGLRGSVGIFIRNEIIELMKGKGVKLIRYLRNGKIRNVKVG